jgi:hypothetical protein
LLFLLTTQILRVTMYYTKEVSYEHTVEAWTFGCMRSCGNQE